MSKVCKECGQHLDDGCRFCPKCGCPNKDFSQDDSGYEKDLRQFATDTEAEETVRKFADGIKKWGTILGGIYVLRAPFNTTLDFIAEPTGRNFFFIVISIISAIIVFFIIAFIAKVIRAVIMVYVNKSITAKRIELDNKKKQ